MATISQLEWSALTPAINNMKSPNAFLKKLLFKNHDPKHTETIELSVLDKERMIAPFVRKNGEALLVQGHDETFHTVETPNIRIKRPFTPSELLYNRRPGTVVFASEEEQINAIEEHIARDLQVMADLVTNSEEYLCALALQGVITYEVSAQEVFEITYPKPAGNNVTLSVFWNDADPTLPDPEENFHTAKTLVSDEVGLNVTDAIMGAEAAQYFRSLMKRQGTLAVGEKLDTGRITFSEQFSEDGAIYLGIFCGVRCWQYSRSVSVDGTATSLIRSKYVEFVAVTPSAEFTLYYGAISDMKALQNRTYRGERFSKSWEVEDPSQLMALVHSRPLPVPRRPGAMVSMKVVSG